MADVKDAKDIEQPVRSQRGKIVLADVGNPAMVKTMTAEQLAKSKGKYFCGTLYGRATGFVERSVLNKPDEVMEGLKGVFMASPSDLGMDELEAGLLWIPDAFHNLVAERLRAAQKVDPSAGVEFAFEVYSIPAKNPAGYSWELVPAVQFVGAHPLAHMIEHVKKIQADKMKQLAAPAKK